MTEGIESHAYHEDRSKILDAMEDGRVVFPEGVEESLASIGRVSRDDPDFARITDVKLKSCWGKNDRNSGGFAIEWRSHGVGFGETVVVLLGDGSIQCDNETMSPGFIKSAFCAMVDGMVMLD